MKKRTWTDSQLATVVQSSRSIRQVALKLGLCGRGGGSSYSIQNHIKRLGLSIDHFLGQSYLKGGTCNWSKKPLEYYLVVGKMPHMETLKKRIIEEKAIEYKCSKCGMGPKWQGEPLVLQLDHKDGDRYNNLLSNLRFLCPNCHTQTTTFAGRRFKKNPSLDPKTGKRIRINARKPRPHTRKTEWPSKLRLAGLLRINSFCAIGRMYNVSDNAVRKWAKRYGLIKVKS